MLARYCQRCDDGDWEAFAELFAADARFVVMGRTSEGRAAIRAFLEGSMPPERRGKHLIAQSDVEVDASGDTAFAVTDFTFVAKVDGGYAITSAGRYHDDLRRDAGGEWRFARREIRFL